MEKLLKWSIENSDPNALANPEASSERLKNLDPEIIETILGKDDSVKMREAMQAIQDNSLDIEDRITAFDNLEMLVEHIDNAKNLTPFNLWSPLISLLDAPEEQIRSYSAWVCATATQNNPKAQQAFLEHNGLQAIIHLLRNAPKSQVTLIKKAFLCLSCSIRHYAPALVQFQIENGFQLLLELLYSSEIPPELKSRLLFLLTSLIHDESSVATTILNHQYYTNLHKLINENLDHHDLVEKVVIFLHASSLALVDHKSTISGLESLVPLVDDVYKNHPESLASQEWDHLISWLNK